MVSAGNVRCPWMDFRLKWNGESYQILQMHEHDPVKNEDTFEYSKRGLQLAKKGRQHG